MISKLMYIVIFRRLSLRFKMLCFLEKSDCPNAVFYHTNLFWLINQLETP